MTTVDIPVAWGDMDAFGHVNNTVFFRWCETARIASFEATGVLGRMASDGVGPILAQASMRFRKPVTYPDTIRASATVRKVGNTSFVLGYQLWSTAQNAEVGAGDSVVVMMDYRRATKVPIEGALRDALLAQLIPSP